MRYYDTETHTETHKESGTTIPHDDIRVKNFFKPLKTGHRLIIVNDLPVIELIPELTQEDITARETAEANQVIYDELYALDIASVRDIREWAVSQPNAPQTLKDREAQAVNARARIK